MKISGNTLECKEKRHRKKLEDDRIDRGFYHTKSRLRDRARLSFCQHMQIENWD